MTSSSAKGQLISNVAVRRMKPGAQREVGMNPAQELHEEFLPRMEHVDEIFYGVKSKLGNFALVMSKNLSKKTLREIAKLIRQEIKERE